MSKKKRKRNLNKVGIWVSFVLSLLLALYCLAYAVESSAVAKDLDACWETAYNGYCVEFSEFEIVTSSYTDCYRFRLDNGKTMYETQWNAGNAGFDAEQFESLCGEPMEFAYTKLIRPFGRYHAVIGIRYQGKDLLSAETMEKHIREDAIGYYLCVGIFLLFSLIALLILLIEPLGRLSKKRRNKRNRKRKQEKKKRYYAKQSEIINPSKRREK